MGLSQVCRNHEGIFDPYYSGRERRPTASIGNAGNGVGSRRTTVGLSIYSCRACQSLRVGFMVASKQNVSLASAAQDAAEEGIKGRRAQVRKMMTLASNSGERSR